MEFNTLNNYNIIVTITVDTYVGNIHIAVSAVGETARNNCTCMHGMTVPGVLPLIFTYAPV